MKFHKKKRDRGIFALYEIGIAAKHMLNYFTLIQPKIICFSKTLSVTDIDIFKTTATRCLFAHNVRLMMPTHFVRTMVED